MLRPLKLVSGIPSMYWSRTTEYQFDLIIKDLTSQKHEMQFMDLFSVNIKAHPMEGGLWCLAPLSTIFQLYRGNIP